MTRLLTAVTSCSSLWMARQNWSKSARIRSAQRTMDHPTIVLTEIIQIVVEWVFASFIIWSGVSECCHQSASLTFLDQSQGSRQGGTMRTQLR